MPAAVVLVAGYVLLFGGVLGVALGLTAGVLILAIEYKVWRISAATPSRPDQVILLSILEPFVIALLTVTGLWVEDGRFPLFAAGFFGIPVLVLVLAALRRLPRRASR